MELYCFTAFATRRKTSRIGRCATAEPIDAHQAPSLDIKKLDVPPGSVVRHRPIRLTGVC